MNLAEAKAALKAYELEKKPVTPFLRALLENNFVGATKIASPEEKEIFVDIANHIFGELPEEIRNSPENVQKHLGEYPYTPAVIEAAFCLDVEPHVIAGLPLAEAIRYGLDYANLSADCRGRTELAGRDDQILAARNFWKRCGFGKKLLQ